MAKGITRVLAQSYPGEIGLHSRDIAKAQNTISNLQIDARPVALKELFNTDILIHTMWFNDALEWVDRYRAELRGKILVDISNPFNETFDDFTIDFDTSAAEEIQKLIPKTTVVTAFKNTYWVVFDNPEFGGIKSDIYVTSNNEIARKKIIGLLKPTPFRIFDAGMLKNSRTIERMTLLEKELATKAGNHPRVSFHLWGIK
ncbi:MAG: NADP oxidoreductase [Pricia sp.]|nr:NADP oxidoreductase [Pricia sp.]